MIAAGVVVVATKVILSSAQVSPTVRSVRMGSVPEELGFVDGQVVG